MRSLFQGEAVTTMALLSIRRYISLPIGAFHRRNQIFFPPVSGCSHSTITSTCLSITEVFLTPGAFGSQISLNLPAANTIVTFQKRKFLCPPFIGDSSYLQHVMLRSMATDLHFRGLHPSVLPGDKHVERLTSSITPRKAQCW